MEKNFNTKTFALLLILVFVRVVHAQDIAVTSFHPLPNDMTARIDAPETDQNGEVCAIIKVVTSQTGFKWEPDGLGIVASPRKTGEYWLYVPRGARRLTIKHDQLGILRNYQYPIPIESAMVYEMVLATGEVEVVVTDREVITQWLVINTQPEEANVFIDEQMVGTTPFQRKYPEGTYNYRLELPRYHNEAGRVDLRGDRQILEINMRPRFGNIQVTSTPENGMMIYVDGENTGQTTPASIEGVNSGQRQVRLQNQWYQPQTQNITVTDNQTTTASFTMQPAFANITIRTEPRAEILVDGGRVATGTHTTRMLAGVYTITAQLDKHHPDRKQITVEAGRDQEVSLQLRPQTGTLDIATVPFNALITLNSETQGTTPTTIRDLLVGDYNLSLSMDGYGTVTRTITIREGETTEVNETLPSGREVTITSTPAGARLTINGNAMGTTPWSGTLAFGQHNVRLVNQTKVVEQTINLTQSGQGRWEFDVSLLSDFTETTSGLNLEMIAVNGGTFTMGCTDEQRQRHCDDDEKPIHQVTVSDYYIGKYEVTQRQWRAVMGNNPSHFSGCENCPVENVSWNDIQEFIRKLNQMTGKNYRLPTEAEWEYAARGGSTGSPTKYAGSNTIGDVAWYADTSGSKTRPVGQKRANELGIYDMSGNVWEWCGDWYGSYTATAKTNPTGPATGYSRVRRGGSWGSLVGNCRVSYRIIFTPDARYDYLGFRLALVP